MADTGFKTASSVTNTSWTSISASAINSSNNTYATAQGTTFLVATCNTFGFGVPTDATIDGIEIQAEFSASIGATNVATLQLSISGNGGSSYTATKSNTVTGTTDTTRTYGGATDLWGEASFSEYATQDGNFYIKLEGKADLAFVSCRLDLLQVKIYYTEANTSGFFLLMGA